MLCSHAPAALTATEPVAESCPQPVDPLPARGLAADRGGWCAPGDRRGLGRRGLWLRGDRGVRGGFFRRRRSGGGHSRPAIEGQADPALRLAGDRAKLARAVAEVGGEGAERGGLLADPAEPGLAGEPGEEEGAERARRGLVGERRGLGHVVGERAPAGRRRPARDRGEALGDHAGREREAHHLGEPRRVLGRGEAGQHPRLARAERGDRAD